MVTATLTRTATGTGPSLPVSAPLPVAPRDVAVASATRTGSRRRVVVLGGAGIIAAVTVLILQLRDADLSSVFTHVHPVWVVLACAATGLSFLAAVRNLTAFTPIALPRADTFRAQLAVCGLRVIAPSAISTPAICARYLTRCGLGAAESLAVVGTAQTAQLLMTMAVVGVLAATGARTVHAPDPLQLALWGGAGIVGVLVLIVVARRIPPVRRALDSARDGLADVLAHARRRPWTVVSGLVASAALTAAHIATFACCVAAVGGHASVLSLTAIYLGAAGAGTLVPTPAGVGAVEAAMIGGLVATGMDAGTATAAALLTRVITVWALALPGWLAMRTLRRRGLL